MTMLHPASTSIGPPVTVGRLFMDPARYLIALDGVALPRPPLRPYRTLYALARRPGYVFTRGELMTELYGSDTYVDDRTIDSAIRDVRRRLEPHGIGEAVSTLYGVGYTLLREALGPEPAREGWAPGTAPPPDVVAAMAMVLRDAAERTQWPGMAQTADALEALQADRLALAGLVRAFLDAQAALDRAVETTAEGASVPSFDDLLRDRKEALRALRAAVR